MAGSYRSATPSSWRTVGDVGKMDGFLSILAGPFVRTTRRRSPYCVKNISLHESVAETPNNPGPGLVFKGVTFLGSIRFSISRNAVVFDTYRHHHAIPYQSETISELASCRGIVQYAYSRYSRRRSSEWSGKLDCDHSWTFSHKISAAPYMRTRLQSLFYRP